MCLRRRLPFISLLLLQENQAVLGANRCNLPHICRVFATIYRSSLSDDATNEKIRRLLSSVGEEQLGKWTATGWSNKATKKVARALKDAQTGGNAQAELSQEASQTSQA
eukprot:GHVT01035591.1.p1 GENE.GHVT01035591.1~~GHVT01035591.1.p1  ORF type:complete len:109 (+),score=27.07 GHVT01035591.1:293-619(+)